MPGYKEDLVVEFDSLRLIKIHIKHYNKCFIEIMSTGHSRGWLVEKWPLDAWKTRAIDVYGGVDETKIWLSLNIPRRSLILYEVVLLSVRKRI